LGKVREKGQLGRLCKHFTRRAGCCAQFFPSQGKLPEALKIDWTNDVISSVIGTLMAIIVISLLGGKIATAWADRQFNRKWQSYREIAADEIEANFKVTYNQTMIYFGGYLKQIAEKAESDISTVDYDLFGRRSLSVVCIS
jgi:hypothetical protein